MLILMDLATDLNEMTTERLRGRGYIPSADDTPDMRYAMLYMHVERIVLPLKYKIEVSKELLENPLYCTLSPIINEITQRLKTGEVVTPYLSRTAQVPNDQPDDMLNYWGIHHLHLSSITTKRAEGTVERADHLLFVRFEEDTAYLIDIRSHKQSHIKVFFDLSLLEVLDSNWPSLHQEVKGVTPFFPTQDELKGLRKHNCNYAIGVNGRTISPRMGLMANGIPSDIPFRYDHLMYQLRMVSIDVRQDYYKYFGLKKNWYSHVKLIGIEDKEFKLRELIGGREIRVSSVF